MKKQTLHQLNRIVYIDTEFAPATTYEFTPAIISADSNVYIYSQPLSTVLSNLGFEWFYVYNYSRYGTGATANYGIYSTSIGGILIDNTEIKFEPLSVETIGTTPSAFFSSLGISKVEYSNDGGTSWTEETGKGVFIGIRVVNGIQHLSVRVNNATGLSGVNKIKFTFAASVNRLYFALYNECKEG